jgi:hypothetical protein
MSCFDTNLVAPHQLVVLQLKQVTDKDAAMGFNHVHINPQCHLDRIEGAEECTTPSGSSSAY